MPKTKASRASAVPSANGGVPFLPEKRKPRSLAISSEGIGTSRDFAKLMSALMSDVLDGSVTPGVANAAVNAGGKLLKVVELQMKYGTQTDAANGEKVLSLTGK